MYNLRNFFPGGELTPLRRILAFLLLITSLKAGSLYDAVLKSAGLRDSVYVDPQTGLVYESHYIMRSQYGEISITPLSKYLNDRLYSAIINPFYRVLKSSNTGANQGTGSGLIPDIEIPIKFPRGLSFIGEGGKLQIEGTQKITLGGTSNYTTGITQTEMARTSHFPQLTMNQELNVKLKGTIGQKIKVEIDHDSRRENKLKNKVILKFEGDDDDIVKLIEAGDTKLDLKGSRLVNFPGGVKKGLFGLKTKFQLGGLSATFVATREQGESQAKTFRASAAMESTSVYAINYIKHRFFYVYDPEGITRVRVFLDDNDPSNDAQQGAVNGVMYYYPTGSYSPDLSIDSVSGKFFELHEGTDFSYNPATRILALKNSLQDGEKLGIYYQTAAGHTVGDLTDTARIVLKILKPPTIYFPGDSLNPHPETHADSAYLEIWNYELRNYYSLGQTNISADQLNLIIYRDSSGILKSGEGGKTYLQLLGLDANGDGKVDRTTNRGFTILDEANGILSFPNPYPFADTILNSPDSSFYWTPRPSADAGKKYILVIKSARASKVYNLGLNVIEGSEVVTVNGQKLERGKDYTIDYDFGILTITNTSVLTPGADIEINYEIAPLFSVKQRSLWGARFEYDFGPNMYIGSTWLGRSESSAERKPRLGEEPLRNFLGGIDFKIDLDMMFLSKLLNKLPFVKIDQPSHFTWYGEYAMSFPNPNTLGKAYLDDMESIKEASDFPINRYYYIFGSQPIIVDNTGMQSLADTSNLVDRLIWATPVDIVKKGDVYPNITDETKDEYMPVLMLIPEITRNHPGEVWASLNTLLSRDGEDFEKKEYLEVVVHGDGMVLHIDFGKNISENSIWRDREGRIKSFSPDTIADEDLNHDGIFEADSEDVGLDMIRGNDDSWTPSSADDGNDDYHYNSNDPHDYSQIDGTEGNHRRDTEDLDRDGVLNTANDYFEYTINLDDTTFLNRYGYEFNGWKHYSIPLRELGVYTKIGDPSWRLIKYGRIWISGMTRTDTLMIATISVVGTKWENTGVHSTDTTSTVDSTESFKVSTVDNKTSPDYTPPPWVEIEKDERGRELKESSLALEFENIAPDHYGLARRILYQEEDFLTYKKIAFSVRLKPGVLPPYPEVFIRFGDTLNYYEYNIQLTDHNWHYIEIPIDSLTQFKLKFLKPGAVDTSYHREGHYGVKGNPSFSRIKVYMLGVRNVSGSSMNGTVWIDDITLNEPIRQKGAAVSTNLQFNLAGITNLSLSYSKEEDNFMKLMDTRRVRGQTESFNISLNSSLNKFLPRQWGFNLPLRFQYNWVRNIPKYQTNTDVLLSPVQKLQEQSITYRKQLNIQFSKSGSKFFLFKYLLDPLNLNFTYNVTSGRSPLKIDTTNVITVSQKYRLAISKTLGFKLLGLKFNFLPRSLSINTGYSKNYQKSFNISSMTLTRNLTRVYSLEKGISFNPINNLSVSYSQKSAFDPDWFNGKWYGTETSFQESQSMTYNLNLFKILTPQISFNSQYREDHSRDIQLDSVPDVRNAALHSELRVSTSLPVSEILLKISNLRDKSKDKDLANAGPVNYLLYLLSKLSMYVTSPQFSFSTEKNFTKYYLFGRPKIINRLGFNTDFYIPSYDTTRNSATSRNNLSLSGGFNIPFINISYSTSYGYSENQQYANAGYTKSYTLPHLEIQFSTLSKLLTNLTDKISNLSISTNFDRTLTKSGNITLNKLTQQNERLQISPIVSLVFRNGLTTNLNYTREVTRTDYFDILATPMSSFNTSLQITSSYTLSRPGGYTINLPGHRVLRIKSSINLQMSIRYSHSQQKRATIISDTFNKSFTLRGTYNFARNITGGLEFYYSSVGDKITGRTNHTVSLNATATFNF